jgi:pimeloyl-ACP methyl ester carboxylesterase
MPLLSHVEALANGPVPSPSLFRRFHRRDRLNNTRSAGTVLYRGLSSETGRAAKARRVFAVLAALLSCCGCSPGRLIDSARLGIEAAAGTADPAAASRVAGMRRQVTLAGQFGDLYLPANPRAALLLIPGVTPEGRDDPRLVAFAGALAGHGFLVFAPELPGLRALRVGRDDPDAVAAAGEALASCYGPGTPPRFAVAAVSYAVAPVVVAATTPPGADRIALVVGIGGYHDVVAAITYFTTGYYRPSPGRPWRSGNPAPIAKWVFVLASASRFPEPRDRALLSEIAHAKLADPDADVRRLEAGLGGGGRAMIALVRNADPERAPELVAALPESVRGDIEYLDLSRRDLRYLRADLLLVHGRDDPLVPATESLALAAAVPPGRADAFIVGNLSHVEIRPGGIPDTLLLWRAAYRLLELRDGLTVPDPARCALADTGATTSGSGQRRRSSRRRARSAAGRGAAAGAAGGSEATAKRRHQNLGCPALTP